MTGLVGVLSKNKYGGLSTALRSGRDDKVVDATGANFGGVDNVAEAGARVAGFCRDGKA